jgi:class 3 adenylate cyclase
MNSVILRNMSLYEKIKAAQGDRGRLEALLLRLDPDVAPPYLELSALGEALLAAGAFAQVRELNSFCIQVFPGQTDPALSACAGTAAANLGLFEEAIESLRQAADTLNPNAAPEQIEHVYAALGRLYKQRALDHAHASGLKLSDEFIRADFRLASSAYRKAYAASNGIWSGINVATLFLLQGHGTDSVRTARGVLTQMDQHPNQGSDVPDQLERQWRLAVRAEAALLMGDEERASQYYEQSAELARLHLRFAHIASMRRQARLIFQARDRDPSRVELWLPRPILAVFSGHRLDASASADLSQTLPARLTVQSLVKVRARMDELLKDKAIRVAFCALSEGADVVFAQAALAAGLELNVILASDAPGLAREWQNLGLGTFAAVIEPILAAASKVYALAPEGPTGSAIDFSYANEILLGTAVLRANECEAQLAGIAVWDRLPARGTGGTASMVQQMLGANMRVQLIDPMDATLRALTGQATLFARQHNTAEHQIKALLFADFVGFSKFTTDQSQQFVQRVLPLVASVINNFEEAGAHVAVRNTWGDGLFLVFDTALNAARFALTLQDQLALLAPAMSFPLKLRVALHYAPVLITHDPISQKLNAIGPGVSRAARLEPATAPGAVYASEALASQLAIARGDSSQRATAVPRCRYLANLPWAKGYGCFPTYVVEPLALPSTR